MLKGDLEREIHEQPEVLERQLERGRDDAEALARAIRDCAPRALVIAARGSSDNAARYAQYLFGAHNRLVVSLATPSLFTIYGSPPSLTDMAVLGISQSGRSPDIVAVVSEARRQGAASIALTNDARSPLAQAAELTLPLYAGEERSVAASKTYTAELVALAMLSAALEDKPDRWEQLAALPDAIRATLARNDDIDALAATYRFAERFVVIGRGFNYCTAFEVSLKIKETSYIIAEPYSSADFLHGPAAMLDRALPIVLVAPSGLAHSDVAELMPLCEERGADVIAISDRSELLGRAATPLPLPPSIPEWLSPIAAVVPGQLFALALARARKLDPDHPRGLSKVTETR